MLKNKLIFKNQKLNISFELTFFIIFGHFIEVGISIFCFQFVVCRSC